ncbi:hypothetical protein DITRI_Ditri10aG0087000 [Diplodiscus trichospermus]
MNLAFFGILCASSFAFLDPPWELLCGNRQQPEDFTVVPVWMDYPNNLAFKLHEMASRLECMNCVRS